ncbi:MAG TPA: NADH-quinone oxidoreductase subunit NuoE [Hellea balneolensis]|uniref:NADH-quinone oxidoreductase subunit NuoE n=1 Tax=Hellea balneolensis TaxID=287478 RepID=A0A7V5U1C1_9PROT|nr:NADH-quinone oxidoreductase subunit NuoE [Hellea balneolensis]
MSGRRMAKQQPESFTLSKDSLKQIKHWMGKYPKGRERSAVIPALWIVQKQAGGWLPQKAIEAVADYLNMPVIRVYEVATFYTMFKLEPVGEHHIQLCGTTPCWLRGADALKKVCAHKIGPNGSVSKDGKLSWEEVECLGACANAPMVQISNAQGDDYYEDLTPEILEQMLDDLAAGKTLKPGPQNKRFSSEPDGGPLALTSKGLYNRVRKKKLPNAAKVKTGAKS